MHPLLVAGGFVLIGAALSQNRPRRRAACVPGPKTPLARCRAILQVVRPDEVSAWAQRAYSCPIHGTTTATAQIADLLQHWDIAYLADRTDRWCSPMATLRRRAGDCDDISVLAVSVLLTSGVDAWVAIGPSLDGKSAHAWVIGVDPLGGPFAMEPQNGQIYWGGDLPGYRKELALGPLGCARWDAREDGWVAITLG